MLATSLFLPPSLLFLTFCLFCFVLLFVVVVQRLSLHGLNRSMPSLFDRSFDDTQDDEFDDDDLQQRLSTSFTRSQSIRRSNVSAPQRPATAHVCFAFVCMCVCVFSLTLTLTLLSFLSLCCEYTRIVATAHHALCFPPHQPMHLPLAYPLHPLPHLTERHTKKFSQPPPGFAP